MSEATDASDVPAFRYDAALADQIERRWQDEWERRGTFNAPNPSGDLADGFERVADRPHSYVLDMFPYPSGDGLHVGHPLGYIGTDVYARYLRMRGENVLHTMGFDAFGLPAEQYAVQTGQHPATTTNERIEIFKRQLRRMGLGHDQRRVIATTDPGFYRWTQWIFLQIFNSFYDVTADRARPIDSLISELDAGTREPDEGTNDFDKPWAELSEVERRTVINRHRLAYISELPVNWCPGLGTVLANEEVTADGRSERGNFPVFRKPLAQWMLRITAYADRLLADLEHIDWPEKVRTMQKNWIGKSTGAHVDFPSEAGDIRVFTTRPDTLFGATYMVLAPEHPLVGSLTASAWPEQTHPVWTGGFATPAEAVSAYQAEASTKTDLDRQGADAKAKTGVFTGSFATNPVTGAEIPIFIADYVLMGYGTGAIMAVPGQDERDWEFAEAFELPIIRTVQPPEEFDGKAFIGAGPAINSASAELDLNGLEVDEAKATMIEFLERTGRGEGATTYRLRDWLFSRQRYWGEPFPIVFDSDDQPIALPESQLPLLLPETNDFSPKSYPPDDVDSEPEPPLGRLADWVTVELDLDPASGEGPQTYRRETNTMPNWAGSCWYELRYLDPNDSDALVGKDIEQYWMGPSGERPLGGVDLYVGGVEHAVLHLLYARFWHKVLYDLGHVTSSEPFHRLVNQGYVQAYAYTDARGMYVPASLVVENDGQYFYDGEPVNREYGKMGKSLKNVTTPDEMYASYGADTLRLFEMFTGPLEQSRPWDTKAVVGSYRLLQRLWRTVLDENTGEPHVADTEPTDELNRLLHKTIHAVRDGYESLRFNTSIARITELNNAVTQAFPHGGTPRVVAESLVLMLAPLAPHAAEELWSRLGHAESLAWEAFPVADPALLVDDTIEIPVQVNGKVRSVINVAADADAATMEAAARTDEKVVAALDGKATKRVVAVPGRLINFVV
jgi:leucyl-tRNA synthetase